MNNSSIRCKSFGFEVKLTVSIVQNLFTIGQLRFGRRYANLNELSRVLSKFNFTKQTIKLANRLYRFTFGGNLNDVQLPSKVNPVHFVGTFC